MGARSFVPEGALCGGLRLAVPSCVLPAPLCLATPISDQSWWEMKGWQELLLNAPSCTSPCCQLPTPPTPTPGCLGCFCWCVVGVVAKRAGSGVAGSNPASCTTWANFLTSLRLSLITGETELAIIIYPVGLLSGFNVFRTKLSIY